MFTVVSRALERDVGLRIADDAEHMRVFAVRPVMSLILKYLYLVST